VLVAAEAAESVLLVRGAEAYDIQPNLFSHERVKERLEDNIHCLCSFSVIFLS